MIKLNDPRTTAGQEISDDELSSVVGAQQQPSRERQEFDRQARDTLNEWGEYLAPLIKPIDATIRLAGATERLIQRSLDHDVRWPINDQQAAQREADAQEKEEQRQREQAADRERMLSPSPGVIDTQQGPPGGGGMPDIPSHMINAPPSDGVQIEISEVHDYGY